MKSDYLRVVGEVMRPEKVNSLALLPCLTAAPQQPEPTTVSTGNTFLQNLVHFLLENVSFQPLFFKTKPCFDE